MMGDWQPKATAPKNTPVLLKAELCDERGMVWSETIGVAEWVERRGYWFDALALKPVCNEPFGFRVVAWMPLPEAKREDYEDKYEQAVTTLRHILQLEKVISGVRLVPTCLERTNGEWIVNQFDREKEAKGWIWDWDPSKGRMCWKPPV